MSSNLQADDAAEFDRPCESLPDAIERAGHVLPECGQPLCDRPADAEVSQILARITVLTNQLK